MLLKETKIAIVSHIWSAHEQEIRDDWIKAELEKGILSDSHSLQWLEKLHKEFHYAR